MSNETNPREKLELNEIKGFQEMLELIPYLVRLRESQRYQWGEGTNEEFVLDFVRIASEGRLTVWASINPETQTFNYFMAAVKESDEVALFWLFFIDVKLRTISAELTQISIDKLKELGYKRIQLATKRVVKSYARWMDKLGFKPTKIMYEKEI